MAKAKAKATTKAKYVDGFVLLVPKNKLAQFKKMASLGCKIWLEHGALDYKECVGEDLEIKGMLSFNKIAKPRSGETVVFSFITYKSRKHRDQVNAKVMKDKRLHSPTEEMPFDMKRMAYGGFEVLVG